MSDRITELRDHIVEHMLETVPQEGWTMAAARDICDEIGIPQDRLSKVFPGGLCDIVAHFSDMMDRAMLARLQKKNIETKAQIRDRIFTAVWCRFDALEPHRDALRLALAYWSVPPRHFRAPQIIWRTADRIWIWAGDATTDYNRYTKRVLLSGILTSTALVWMKDESPNHEKTRTFLENRIENALQFGQIMRGFGHTS